MNASTRAHLFEPLFTTKDPGKGTGLGLVTVQNIVKACGGHIEVYSELGRGTSFKVYLPRVEDAAPARSPASDVHQMPRGTETILLVEDEDCVRFLARKVLEICGYTVLEAPHGEEAIRLFESHDGVIDMLVSDVVMPRLDGRSLADRLISLRPDLKVLFLSGYPDTTVVQHGVLAPEAAFLQKPFTTAALASKVRMVLDMRK